MGQNSAWFTRPICYTSHTGFNSYFLGLEAMTSSSATVMSVIGPTYGSFWVKTHH